MDQPNLFDYKSRYPHTPAARNTDTSRAAAKSMRPRAPTLREQILALFREGHEMTPDECAHRMYVSILSIRPRFTELDRLGKIVPTGETRANAVSGHKAQVYRLGAFG